MTVSKLYSNNSNINFNEESKFTCRNGTYILYPFAVSDVPLTTTAFTFTSDAILDNCIFFKKKNLF